MKSLGALEKYFGEEKTQWPAVLARMCDKIDDHDLAISALGIAICYLENALVAEQIVRLA